MLTCPLRYTAAASPFLVPLGLLMLAKAVGHVVGCHVPFSAPAFCLYEYVDVNPLLGPVATWAERLLVPGFVLSCALLALLWLRRDRVTKPDRLV